jgi:phage terminase large subunit
MPLSDAQKRVAQSTKRFRVVCAGRRFGKSILAIRELAKFASQPNKKVMYVAPTYGMARNIIFDQLKQKLDDLRWVKKINETRMEIDLVNGSRIMLRGADNYDSLRGTGVDFLVMDEMADIKPEAWSEVLRPTLSAQKPPGSALFVGTPKGHNHFKDLFDLGKTDDDWESWAFTTLDGGNVSAEEIEAAKRDLSQKVFNQEYMATFESYSGLVYYNFSLQDSVKKWEKPEKPLKEVMLFCDFNINPISGAVAVRTPNGIHIIDEIVIYGSNTDELAQEMRTRYPNHMITCFPDPAGAQRKTSAGGRTDISILQNAGFKVLYKPRHPAVKDRINAVNSLLLNTNKERRLFVDPKCKEVIKSLSRHTYKEGTQIPNKDDGFDHMCDAVGYGVEYLFPVTREIENRNPKSFGVF